MVDNKKRAVVIVVFIEFSNSDRKARGVGSRSYRTGSGSDRMRALNSHSVPHISKSSLASARRSGFCTKPLSPTSMGSAHCFAVLSWGLRPSLYTVRSADSNFKPPPHLRPLLPDDAEADGIAYAPIG